VGDAVTISISIVSVGDEEIMNRAKSVEGDGVAKWHGEVEVNGIV
jgi:hypothetical protein